MMKGYIQRFNKIEQKYIHLRLNDVQVWPLIREDVYQELMAKLTKTSRPNTSDKDQTFFNKIKSVLLIIYHSIYFLFSKKGQKDYLFLNHPRKKKVNGKFFDIYTDPIIDELDNNYIVFERLFQMKHLKPSYRSRILYGDIFDFWPRLLSLFYGIKFSEDKIRPWVELEKEINHEYGIKIDIVNKIKIEFNRFNINYIHLKKLLLKIKPKVIYEVVGYNRFVKHINIIAKELSIPTVELQHGFISKHHIGYNFPNSVGKVDSFPDYISLWGEFYKKRMTPPIPDKDLLITGFKYFDLNRNNFNKLTTSNPDKHMILFISQGTIGKDLGKLAFDLSKNINPEKYHITYKLHPSEIQDSKNRYGYMYNNDNITVADNSSIDLYKLITNSETVIGVYSTALIEAMALGKGILVLKLEGWKSFIDLIEDPDITFEAVNTNINDLKDAIIFGLNEENRVKPEFISAYRSNLFQIESNYRERKC